MRKVERISRKELEPLIHLVPEAEDRDDMAIPTYLHGNRLIQWLFWRRLDVAYGLLRKDRYTAILDYGCGTGTLLPTLSGRSENVYGCDKRTAIASELVARRGLENVRVIDVEGFRGLPAGSLDTIISADVLEHVDPLEPLVSEFHDKLRPQGELIISGPTENHLYSLGRAFAGFSGDYHVTNILDIDKVVTACSFRRTNRVCLPFPFLPSFMALFHICRYVRAGEAARQFELT